MLPTLTRCDVRVLVLCTVHDPRDARVSGREIAALLEAGHQVTQAAPFSDFAVQARPGVVPIDIPAARGRHRARALRAARTVLRREGPRHDVVILHNPEAVLAAAGMRHQVLVWDVHEDTAAAISMKDWIPGSLKRPAAALVRRLERYAERHMRLMLAESAYAERFARPHPIVPNTTVVPDSAPATGRGRLVYVGTLTRERGGDDLVEVGRRLPADIELQLVGTAHGSLATRLSQADANGLLRWRGYLPNDEALALVEGATAGLSLLHDEPNYRHSMPTKLYEYLARGVPFISTPLPLARELAEASGAGIIVPFGDPRAAVEAACELNGDDERRQAMADAGRRWMRENADWRRDGAAFVEQLERWAQEG